MREQPRLLSALSAGYHIFISDGEIFFLTTNLKYYCDIFTLSDGEIFSSGLPYAFAPLGAYYFPLLVHLVFQQTLSNLNMIC